MFPFANINQLQIKKNERTKVKNKVRFWIKNICISL